MIKMEKAIYEVQKGGRSLFHGTREEIAEEMHISVASVQNYSSPSYLKKNVGKDVIKIYRVE